MILTSDIITKRFGNSVWDRYKSHVLSKKYFLLLVLCFINITFYCTSSLLKPIFYKIHPLFSSKFNLFSKHGKFIIIFYISVHEYVLLNWLGYQEDNHRMVLYQCDSYMSEWTKRCVRQVSFNTKTFKY